MLRVLRHARLSATLHARHSHLQWALQLSQLPVIRTQPVTEAEIACARILRQDSANPCHLFSMPVWYTYDAQGWRERPVHDVPEWKTTYTGRVHHTGWFTNHDGSASKDGSGRAWGLVVSLPHGRYLAGYQWGDNDERVYFAELYDDLKEACIAADAHAQAFAEAQQEDSRRFDEMTDLEGVVSDREKELRRLVALRNHPAGDRDETRDLIATLRKTREEYDEAVKAYEKGE